MMTKKKNQRLWAYKPERPKFAANEKKEMLDRVKTVIDEKPKLSQKVSRLEMRGNRIYLYELVEQFKPEGAVFIKSLIEDKYLEFPYARITLNDAKGDSCTVDFQRHNDQWMSLYGGTLTECINHIEDDNTWF